MSYAHHSNWEPIAAQAWVAMTGEQYDQIHESTGGVDGSGRDTMVIKNGFFVFQPKPGDAIANANELRQKEKKPVVICALGFSELTCINGLQCAMHGDTMDFPVTVLERLKMS
jgi:hypothetical protein